MADPPSFGGSRSMRENYETQGVAGYYSEHGSSYRNPHFDAIVAATAVILDYWYTHLQRAGASSGPSESRESAVPCQLRMLDLACGSGEASQAIEHWWQERQPAVDALTGQLSDAPTGNIRPHNAGTPQLLIEAADPFTGSAYHQWTGRQAHTWSFEDVAAGLLLDQGLTYHLVVSSYALHVMDPASGTLFACLQQLALCCQYLLILSPHKLPKVEASTGWQLVQEVVEQRVHARLFMSCTLLPDNEHKLLQGL